MAKGLEKEMDSVFPEAYYKDPSDGAVEALSWEQERLRRKAALKQIKADRGCSCCTNRDSPVLGLFPCKIGKEPGEKGYCPDHQVSQDFMPWRNV